MDYKADYKGESKGEGSYDRKTSNKEVLDEVDETLFDDKAEGKYEDEEALRDIPKIEVLDISISPNDMVEISSPLSLSIRFSLDRDVVAAYWVVQFLVDTARSRLIRILGETEVEDYVDGESEMQFFCAHIDVDDIAVSSLSNSGLLMARLMVDGEEVASVNLVVQVTLKQGVAMRQIFSPLD
ncbi:hypothetical protein EON64_11900 [archaeon]|nr:MAG: hypothetical protein EON64_11900 [archaeon]